MGYEDQLTAHGTRATLSTALHEIGYPKPWIDAQLSHTDPDRVSAAYNHAEYVEQRRAMMQDWADQLEFLERGQVGRASTRLTIHLQGVAGEVYPNAVLPSVGEWAPIALTASS